MTEVITEELDGRLARSVDSLTGMLGWNSVAVFEAGEHRDGDRLKVNKATIYVMLADPYPEYTAVVLMDGEHHHTEQVLSMTYEEVFENHLEDYGEAKIVSLSELSHLQRDEHGAPEYVDPETEDGRDV